MPDKPSVLLPSALFVAEDSVQANAETLKQETQRRDFLVTFFFLQKKSDAPRGSGKKVIPPNFVYFKRSGVLLTVTKNG